MTGTIISESTKGFCYAEADDTHRQVFIHIRYVKDERCLHIDDRVKFVMIPNPHRPGQQMAGDVEYIGRVIARQVSDRGVQS